MEIHLHYTAMEDLPRGYTGKILEIDLNSLSYRRKELPPFLAHLFGGGRGLSGALLVQSFISLSGMHSHPFQDIFPLNPDNPIIFAASPLTGTSVPTASRFHAGFKSPLTGGIGSASSGGKWGVVFKRTGHDALILKGRSPRPVIIYIDEDEVRFDNPPIEIHDVENITASLEAKYGTQAKVMTVGKAAKNLSRIASIMNDRGRTLGRGGTGAVLASKNCYAVVVKGSRKTYTAHPEKLKPGNLSGSVFKGLAKIRMGKLTKPPRQFGILSSMGTGGLLGMLAQYHELLHRNFQDNRHLPNNLEKIKGEALASHTRIEVKRKACYNCPIGCTRNTRIRESEFPAAGEGPEFETIAMLGANLDIYDLELITHANYLCNRMGLDTISMGGTLASLMEIFEEVIQKNPENHSPREKIFLKDIESFRRCHGEPCFGNTSCLLPLIQATAERKGIGRYTAEGAFRLCRRYGHPEIAMTVKKMELPAYDPRAVWTQALSYIISPRGGCHLQGGYSAPLAFCAGYGEFPGNRSEGAALVARNAAFHNCAYDFLGVCAFAGFSVTLDEWAGMWNDVTGKKDKASDLETTAKRILTLERLFNLLCGLSYRDDWLPERFFEIPIQAEGQKQTCSKRDFKKMRLEFYQAMGWDEQGIPYLDTFTGLELDHILPLGKCQEWLQEKQYRRMT